MYCVITKWSRWTSDVLRYCHFSAGLKLFIHIYINFPRLISSLAFSFFLKIRLKMAERFLTIYCVFRQSFSVRLRKSCLNRRSSLTKIVSAVLINWSGIWSSTIMRYVSLFITFTWVTSSCYMSVTDKFIVHSDIRIPHTLCRFKIYGH